MDNTYLYGYPLYLALNTDSSREKKKATDPKPIRATTETNMITKSNLINNLTKA